jgi:hypothetical protein
MLVHYVAQTVDQIGILSAQPDTQRWEDDGGAILLEDPRLVAVEGSSEMKWVTRERPKVDRIACPWLIKRFVDPEAEFLYAPANQVLDVADR